MAKELRVSGDWRKQLWCIAKESGSRSCCGAFPHFLLNNHESFGLTKSFQVGQVVKHRNYKGMCKDSLADGGVRFLTQLSPSLLTTPGSEDY